MSVVLFLAAVGAVLVVGPRMARVADRLGEVTGMGGGLFGLVFLALATDLPEVALAPTAVVTGTPGIAVGNLVGSAAVQLTLLAVVDIAVRKGRLYEKLPLRATLGQCALMLSVVAVPLVAAAGVPALGNVSIATFALPTVYFGVLALVRGIDAEPPIGEGPSAVDDATEDGEHTGGSGDHQRALWTRFASFAVVLAAAGVALESSSEALGSRLGLGETAAGALLASAVTPLPELVTAVAAARQGALELAVGDLVGSSALDVMLLSWADVFYSGSIFDLFGRAEIALLGVTLGVTALLVVGLARGERARQARISLESYLMLAVYGVGVVVMLTAPG
ncbi:MAG: sodium:calcium antiporter [Acidimicrobiia bacterium]